MKTNTRVKAQAIKVGDDVKNVRVTPGARAGVAVARTLDHAINKTAIAAHAVVTNIADFGRCFWKGKYD